MLLNVTQSRLVIGRFTILPGDKVPAFALTDAETRAVEDFRSRGFLAEKEMPKPQAAPDKARKLGKGMSKPDAKQETDSEVFDKLPQHNDPSGENKGE